jgi:hypothetical protein
LAPFALRQLASVASSALRASRFAAMRSASAARTSSGTSSSGSVGQPAAAFVTFTSSGPSGGPWALLVPATFGLPRPIVVRVMMSDGRS